MKQTANDLAQRAATISEDDRRVWKLLSNVAHLTQFQAIYCAVLNLIFAGLGTMVSSYLVDRRFNKTQLCCGFAQMFMGFFLVGWVWAQYWSYLMIVKARSSPVERSDLIPSG